MPRNVQFGFKDPQGGPGGRGTFQHRGMGGAFGNGVARYFSDMKHGLKAARRDFQEFLIDMWIEIVLGTAWDAPPAPVSSIIGERKGLGRVRLGWHNFKGSQSAAVARFKVRQAIMSRIVDDLMADPRFSFGLNGLSEQRAALDAARQAVGVGKYTSEGEAGQASARGARRAYGALRKSGSPRSFKLRR